MTASQPLLAIICGPTVTTWDCRPQRNNNDDNDDVNNTLTATDEKIDATVVGGSGGVRKFQPYGGIDNGVVVSDVAWNHNSQVVATCSTAPYEISSSSPDPNPKPPNVVLTSITTLTQLDSFHSYTSSSTKSSTINPTSTSSAYATSINFAGRSRYLSISDTSGLISIWDLKKHTRARHFHLPSSSPGGAGCRKSCIDPTDTFVAALSMSNEDGNLYCYNLRTNKIAMTLRPPDEVNVEEGGSGARIGGGRGGGHSMSFSQLMPNVVGVGTGDGSVLIWDIADSGAGKEKKKQNNKPVSSLDRRHNGVVSGVAFSPTNIRLIASCSLDGTMAFHDVKNERTIQVFKVGSSTKGGGGGGSAASAAAIAGGGNNNSVDGGGGATCLSFHEDGVTFATGTTCGSVLVYDLRKAGSGPLSTLNVSNGNTKEEEEVKSVQFAIQVSQERTGGGKTPRSMRKKRHGTPKRGNTTAEKSVRKEHHQVSGARQVSSPTNSISSAAASSLDGTATEERPEEEDNVIAAASSTSSPTLHAATTSPTAAAATVVEAAEETTAVAPPAPGAALASSIVPDEDEIPKEAASSSSLPAVAKNLFPKKELQPPPPSTSLTVEESTTSDTLTHHGSDHHPKSSVVRFEEESGEDNDVVVVATTPISSRKKNLPTLGTPYHPPSSATATTAVTSPSYNNDDETATTGTTSISSPVRQTPLTGAAATARTTSKKDDATTTTTDKMNDYGRRYQAEDLSPVMHSPSYQPQKNEKDNDDDDDDDRIKVHSDSDDAIGVASAGVGAVTNSPLLRTEEETTTARSRFRNELNKFTAAMASTSDSSSGGGDGAHTAPLSLPALVVDFYGGIGSTSSPSTTTSAGVTQQRQKQSSNVSNFQNGSVSLLGSGRNGNNDVDLKVNKLVLQSMVQDAVESLRDDMEESIQNLHVDVIKSFQRQSDELVTLFEKQRKVMDSLLKENQELREENERLRRIY